MYIYIYLYIYICVYLFMWYFMHFFHYIVQVSVSFVTFVLTWNVGLSKQFCLK